MRTRRADPSTADVRLDAQPTNLLNDVSTMSKIVEYVARAADHVG
jgi:hypothetical protein